MNVKYMGPMRDFSGYGEANRHAVLALDAAGVNVIGELVSYQSESSDFGSIGEVIDRVLNQKGDYQVKILHTTPDEYARVMEPGKYHIAHFFWETDKVPELFADGLKLVDEIWTGSEANRKAIQKAGVTRPVHVFPQAIQVEREWPDPYVIPDFDGHLFYSIFEWTDRKNPEALLTAYLDEFTHKDNVGLLIKTYFSNFTLQNKKMIRRAVQRIKEKLATEGRNFPPVFLYLDLMDRHQVERLHKTGDCFVSAHRGEGWGIPQVEAALCGNPIISTGYGGAHEYFNDDQAQLIPYGMVPVTGMDHSHRFYTADQNWADPKVDSIKSAMRWAYENREAASRMGANGQALVKDRFSPERVGKEMRERIKTIEEQL